jgi:hypothetical protein
MKRSRLRLALLLSALMHVLVLGLLRYIPLAALIRPAAAPSDAPVAVQLLELPPQPQPQIAQTPERARKLPKPRHASQNLKRHNLGIPCTGAGHTETGHTAAKRRHSRRFAQTGA